MNKLGSDNTDDDLEVYTTKKRFDTILCGAKKSNRLNEKFFEHFAVIGPSSDSDKVEIMYSYPEGKKIEYENELKEFCVPFYTETRKIKRSNSLTSVNALMFGKLSDLENSSNSFTFLLNVGEKLVYGICVLSEELMNLSPSFISQSNQGLSNDLSFDLVSGLRCYCILSQFPFFEAHFNVIYSLLAQERLHNLQFLPEISCGTSKSAPSNLPSQSNHLKNANIGRSRRLQFCTPPAILISNVDSNDDDNDNDVTNEKTHSIKLIESYYAMKVPLENEYSDFILNANTDFDSDSVSCHISVPAGTDMQMIEEWSMPCLFRVLTIDEIVSFYNCLLLEKSVVIVCSNPGVLSALVLSVIPLLYPLIWQGPLITVLPPSMHELLDSPVPIIVGLNELPEDRRGWNDPMIININNRSTTLPAKMEPLPDRKKLLNDLKGFHAILNPSSASSSSTLSSLFNNSGNNSPNSLHLSHNSGNTLSNSGGAKRSMVKSVHALKKPNTIESGAITNSIILIRKYSSTLLDNYVNRDVLFKLAADMHNQQVIETIAKASNKAYQPFVRQLIATQQFHVHVGRIHSIDLIANCPDLNTSYQKIDRLLEETELERDLVMRIIKEHQEKLCFLDERVKSLSFQKEQIQQALRDNKESSGFTSPRNGKELSLSALSASKRTHKRNKSWFH